MRRDRDGSELEDDDTAVTPAELAHVLRCREGWLGEDWRGRPIPCPVCRPHLARRRRRARAQLFGPWAA